MITNHDEWQRWNVLSSAEWWGSVCWYGTRLEASYLIWKWYHWTAFLITSHRSRNLTGSANILFYTPCHLPTLLHLLLKALQRLICFSWIVTDCCQNILAKFFQANVMFNYVHTGGPSLLRFQFVVVILLCRYVEIFSFRSSLKWLYLLDKSWKSSKICIHIT